MTIDQGFLKQITKSMKYYTNKFASKLTWCFFIFLFSSISQITQAQSNCTDIPVPTGKPSASICEKIDVRILANVANPGLTVDWYLTPSGGMPIATASPLYEVVAPQIGTTLFYAEAREISTGCKSATRFKFTLNVLENPKISIGKDTVLCGLSFYSPNPIFSTNNAPLDFFWSSLNGGDVYNERTSMPTFVSTEPSTKYLKVDYSNVIGCRTSDTIKIEYRNVPSITNEILKDTVCSGQLSEGINFRSDSLNVVFNWTSTSSNVSYMNQSGSGNILPQIYIGNGTVEYSVSIANLNCFVEPLVFTTTVIDRPTVTIGKRVCNPISQLYSVDYSSTGIVMADQGIVGQSNIVNIRSGVDVNLTISRIPGYCDTIITVKGLVCDCSSLPLPSELNTITKCEKDTTPYFRPQLDFTKYTLDWYRNEIGGSPVAIGQNIYQPLEMNPGLYSYYAEVRDINTSCISATRVLVYFQIIEAPQVSVAEDKFICSLDSVFLNAIVKGSGPFTLEWKSLNGGTFSSTSVINPVYRPSGIGSETIFLKVTDGQECSNADSLIVTIGQSPSIVNETTTFFLCDGSLFQGVNLSSNSIGTTYDWRVISNTGITGFTSIGQGNIPSQLLSGSGKLVFEVTPSLGQCIGRATLFEVNVASNTPSSILISNTLSQDCKNKIELSVPTQANFSYQWFRNDTLLQDSISNRIRIYNGVNFLSNYKVRLVNNLSVNCSSFTAPIQLTPSAGGVGSTNISICKNDSIILKSPVFYSGNNATKNWFKDGLIIPGATNQNYIVRSPGVYKFRATDANGLNEIFTCDFSVLARQIPSFIVKNKACQVQNGTYSIEFSSKTKVITSLGSLVDSVIINIPDNQNVSITLVDTITKCDTTFIITKPTCNCPSVNAPTSLNTSLSGCLGTTISALKITPTVGNIVVDWYASPSGGIPLATATNSYTPANLEEGNNYFYAQARDAVSNCLSSERLQFSYFVTGGLNVLINTIDPICLGSMASLSSVVNGGTAPFTYIWSSLSNGTFSNSATSETSYFNNLPGIKNIVLTVFDINGCVGRDTAQLLVQENLIVQASNDKSVCSDSSILLSVLNPQVGYSYNWTSSDVAILNPTQQQVRISSSTLGTKKIYVTATNNLACIGRDSVLVTFVSKPILNQVNDILVCSGSRAIISTIAVGSGPFSYSWSSLGSSVLENTNGSSTALTPLSNERLIVKVNDVNQCISFDTIDINLLNLPIITLKDNDAVCLGAKLDLPFTVIATEPLTTNWRNIPGANLDLNIFPNQFSSNIAGSYKLFIDVTDGNGCKNVDSIQISVTSLPLVNIGNDTSLCGATQITLFNRPAAINGSTYLWSSNELGTFSSNTVPNPIFTKGQSNNYQIKLIVSDAAACSAADSLLVSFTETEKIILNVPSQLCSNEKLMNVSATPIGGVWKIGEMTFVSTSEMTQIPTSILKIGANNLVYIYSGSNNICSSKDSVNVNIVQSPIISDVVVTPGSSCNTNDATISVLAGNTSSLIQYSVTNEVWSSNSTFNNLAPGSYNVLVRNMNEFICNSDTFKAFVLNSKCKIDTIRMSSAQTTLNNLCIQNNEILNSESINVFDGARGNINISTVNDADLCFEYTSINQAGRDTFGLVVKDLNGSMDTTIFIVKTNSTLDTMRVIGTTNELLNICLDLTDLPGSTYTKSICDAPENGNIQIGFNVGQCFSYLPNLNFIGKDELCIVAIDQLGFVDTTIVLLDIQPGCAQVMNGSLNVCNYLSLNPESNLGLQDCDQDGVNNITECINNFDPRLICSNGYTAQQLCVSVNSNVALANADCDSGGLTNLQECISNLNPLMISDDTMKIDITDPCLCSKPKNFISRGVYYFSEQFTVNTIQNTQVTLDLANSFGLYDSFGNPLTSNLIFVNSGAGKYILDVWVIKDMPYQLTAKNTVNQSATYGNICTEACVQQTTISGFVFEDLNGNGQKEFGEPGINNVPVYVINNLEEVIDTVFTNSDGLYTLTSIFSGEHFIRFGILNEYLGTLSNIGNDNTDNDVTGANGINSTDKINLSNQSNVVGLNGGFIRCIPIGQFVWYDSDTDDLKGEFENGLNGLKVRLYKRNQDNSFSIYKEVKTDVNPRTVSEDGFFEFCVLPGTYYIQVVIPPSGIVPAVKDIRGFQNLNSKGEFINDSDINRNGITDVFTVRSGDSVYTIGAGFYPMATVGNQVWNDINYNGIQESSEPKVADVLIEVFNKYYQKIDETKTDAAGNYRIANLGKDEYFLKFTPPAGYGFTLSNTGGELLDSDVDHSNGSNTTTMYKVDPAQNYLNIDAGIAFGALPVTWLSVYAKQVGQEIQISWITATEVNTKHFEVEKKNRFGQWEIICTIPASGNSQSINYYTCLDNNIEKGLSNLYRVKQIDLDNSTSYSKEVELWMDASDVIVKLYPVPAKNSIYLDVNIADEANVDLVIVDVFGKQLSVPFTGQAFKKGNTSIPINIEGLTSGIYVAMITINGVKYETKFIVSE
jgi:hypothetical protein